MEGLLPTGFSEERTRQLFRLNYNTYELETVGDGCWVVEWEKSEVKRTMQNE